MKYIALLILLFPTLLNAADFTDFPKWNRIVKTSPLVASSQEEVTEKTLLEVNKSYNKRIKYLLENKDYWQTPGETLAKGTGDCEDIAIAKYYELASKGIPVENMQLVIGDSFGIMHTVLMVKLDDEVYFLDNRSDSLATKKQIFSQIAYGINHKGWTRKPL